MLLSVRRAFFISQPVKIIDYLPSVTWWVKNKTAHSNFNFLLSMLTYFCPVFKNVESKETYGFQSVHVPGQNLDTLHDDGARDNGVGSGDSRNDVACHGLDVKLGLLGDVEDMRANVGAGSHEIHSWLIIFVPDQVIIG